VTRAGEEPESRLAFLELLDALREIDVDYIGTGSRPRSTEDAEPDSARSDSVAEGHRFLMHLLGGGLDLFFEADPANPRFRPTLQAGRKFYGDNPDAIYHSTMVRPDLEYKIRGNTDGAVYLSFTVEGGGDIDERYPPGRVVATKNDSTFEIAPNGDYEILVSRQFRAGNWLELSEDACSIIARHYFEGDRPVDRSRRIPVSIEVLGGKGSKPGPPEIADAASVARGIRRVRNFVRGLSIDYKQNGPPLDFASLPPNAFSDPSGWNEKGQAAVDQSNLFARFELSPDEVLVIEGRYPRCRFGNFVIWNRHLQTFEYERRCASLNRRQTQLEPDGSFRIVLAGEDPGVANWLDTAGALSGVIFVRYLLPEEQPERLTTRVMKRGALG
jgi:hypothetical protein